MTAVMTAMKRWQDEYLTMLARVEEPVVRFTGRAAESVVDYLPERPTWAFLKEVPTMSELVESQLKFRKRVIDEQTAFVRKLMKAASPKLARHEPTAPAAKRAARKPAPARRVRPRAAA